MPLPVVSEEIRRSVESEWLEVNNNYAVLDFIAKVKWELEQTNPVVAQFFDNILRKPPSGEIRIEKLVYFCSVCKMLELAGAMVKVSYETSAPVQTEFLRDPTAYGQELIERLEKENPEIINIVRPLINRFQVAGDIISSSKILTSGLLLYKIIESQKEANDLTDSLESFGSNA